MQQDNSEYKMLNTCLCKNVQVKLMNVLTLISFSAFVSLHFYQVH